MKLSWTSLKISIAGAKLSHLAQKDRLWDHGSMVEHAKTVFFKLKRAKQNKNIGDLKKYLTNDCYERIKQEFEELENKKKQWVVKNLLIKDAAIIQVKEGRDKKPDCFTAMIRSIGIQFITNETSAADLMNYSDKIGKFSEYLSFVHQGEWWVLDKIG